MSVSESMSTTSEFATCSCSQDVTRVILIGCTQQGKTSFLQSLYEYAGRKAEGDRLEIGTSEESVTKTCTAHDLVINIREHILRDEDGNVWSVNAANIEELLDMDEDGELEHEIVNNNNGRHVHLRVIDTPGLDDSDNAQVARKAASASSGNDVTMRLVDERHKLDILQALAREGEINSVCFVLSAQQTLGKTMLELLGEYRTLFDASGLGASYHFVHTHVEPNKEFETRSLRPPAVRRTLIISTAYHHFVNSIPKDILDIYMAQKALVNFVETVAEDKSHLLRCLQYPKTDGHRFMETYFQEVIGLEQNHHQDEALAAQQQQADLELQLKVMEAREGAQRKVWDELRQRVEKLNTFELVEMAHRKGRAEAQWFVTSRVEFNFSTDYPIRKVESFYLWPNASWSPNLSSESFHGLRHFKSDLVAHGMNDTIDGWIKLFTWKRDKYASEIQRLSTERDEASRVCSTTHVSISTTRANISKAIESALDHRSCADSMTPILHRLHESHVSFDTIQSRGRYLATTSFIAYAYALRLDETKIPRGRVQPLLSSDVLSKATTLYNIEKKKNGSMLTICKSMACALDKREDLLETVYGSLRRAQDDGMSHNKAIEKHLNALAALASPEEGSEEGSWVLMLPESEREDAEKALEVIRGVTRPAVQHTSDLAQDLLNEQTRFARDRTAPFKDALTAVIQLIDGNKRAAATWLETGKEAKVCFEAARGMLDVVLPRALYSVGLVSLLSRATNQHESGSEGVLEAVFNELRECYTLDPDNWSTFLESVAKEEPATNSASDGSGGCNIL